MRKTLLSFAGLFVMSLLLISCNNNTPKSVANSWLTSFYHLEFENAKKQSTEDTKRMLDMFEQLTQKQPDSAKQQLKKIKIDIKDVKEEGDKATVMYVSSDNPGAAPETLHLVKQNGKWLVQWSKQDQMNDAGGNPPAGGPGDQSGPADSTASPASSPASTPNSADTAMGKQNP